MLETGSRLVCAFDLDIQFAMWNLCTKYKLTVLQQMTMQHKLGNYSLFCCDGILRGLKNKFSFTLTEQLKWSNDKT